MPTERIVHGGDRRSEAVKDQGNDVTLIRGNRATYLRARLERDHPEVLARLERGEHRSVRARCSTRARTNQVEGFTAFEARIGERQGQRTDLLPEKFREVPAGMETAEWAAKKAGFGNETTARQAERVVDCGVPERDLA